MGKYTFSLRLTNKELAICEATIKGEKGMSEKLRRPAIVFKVEFNGSAWNHVKISQAVGRRTRTDENIRQALVLEGF